MNDKAVPANFNDFAILLIPRVVSANSQLIALNQAEDRATMVTTVTYDEDGSVRFVIDKSLSFPADLDVSLAEVFRQITAYIEKGKKQIVPTNTIGEHG